MNEEERECLYCKVMEVIKETIDNLKEGNDCDCKEIKEKPEDWMGVHYP